MRFDVVRQPLIPAFLSLVILTTAALCSGVGFVLPADLRCGLTPAELPLLPLGNALLLFQQQWPATAKVFTALLIIYTGLSLGRLTVRCTLYGTGTSLPIPLFGMVLLGVLPQQLTLKAVVGVMLLALSVKNFARAYRNEFSFDRLFRGSLFLALLLLVEPAAAPLVLLPVAAVVRFRRTGREALVTLGGLLLPPLTLAYLNWACGGSLAAPFAALWRSCEGGGSVGAFLLQTSLAERIFLGWLIVLNLLAMLLFRTNSYNVSMRARHILLFTNSLLLLSLLTLPMPAASASTAALLTVPATLLLPVFFIRIHASIAKALYLLWLAATLAGLFLQ